LLRKRVTPVKKAVMRLRRRAARALTPSPAASGGFPLPLSRSAGEGEGGRGMEVRASAVNSACRNDQRSREPSCPPQTAEAFR
jgi:hypothetical protein